MWSELVALVSGNTVIGNTVLGSHPRTHRSEYAFYHEPLILTYQSMSATVFYIICNNFIFNFHQTKYMTSCKTVVCLSN